MRRAYEPDSVGHVLARLLVEVVGMTRRSILTSRAVLPYTLAACVTATAACASLGYALVRLWPVLRQAIHLATAP